MKVTVRENNVSKSDSFPCWRIGLVSGDVYLMLSYKEGVQLDNRNHKLFKHNAGSIDFESMTKPFHGSFTVEVD